MKKNNVIIIILFGTLGIFLLVYFIMNNQVEKRYQWDETYRADSDQPYGTMFIKELLEDYRKEEHFTFNDKKPLHELLDSAALKDSTDYVFIGQNLYLDEADRSALLNFISSGNDAFIASTFIPFDVIDSIFVNECNRKLFLEEHPVISVTLNFYHASLSTKEGVKYAYRSGKDDHIYFWNSLNREIFCDSTKSVVPLAYQQPDQINFLKFPYGRGNLYFHCNPIVFTNYFLTKSEKAAYASSVFSHLHGNSMIWDEFSKAEFTENNAPEPSPLSYILDQPSLKYAWWMMLVCVILYTFFAAKRRQRVIPVLEEKVNSSLEFIKMVSALHFQNANNIDMTQKKVKYFFYFIRSKYGIHTQELTPDNVKKLSEKSKVEITDIQNIYDELHHLERNPYNIPGPQRLMVLNHVINQFYKKCK